MLESVSCWYVDWANIGAWVGGIGSAAAAIAAVWIARRDTTKRNKYAQFLFKRDIEKLIQLEVLLRQSAVAMEDLEIHRGEHLDEMTLKLMKDKGFEALGKLQTELEYFGRSDMLFEYNPATEDFAKLQSAIRYLEAIPDFVSITYDRFDGVAAAEAMLFILAQLTEALKPFAPQALRDVAPPRAKPSDKPQSNQ